MILRKLNIKAQAAMEYIFVITLIMFTLLIFQKYITRAFVGRWKGTGDSFSQGRQYDPNSTLRCAYDFQYTNSWYDEDLYDTNNCARECKMIYGTPDTCEACIRLSYHRDCNAP